MARPATATLDLLKVRSAAGKPIGVIVLKDDEQIRGGARRLLNLAKDVAVDRLVVASERDGAFSVKSFLSAESKPEAIPDVASARLAVAALRRTKLWRARGTLTVDVSGTRIECGGDEPEAQIERRKIWSIVTLDEDLSRMNAEVRQMVVACFSSGMGVIPFVGAGLSAQFNFPEWGTLLTSLASGKSKPAVQRLVAADQYEKAAQKLYEGGRAADRLQAGIMATFKRKFPAQAFDGSAVSLLPHLTCGPVVTTNFDQVLERVFESANRPFKGSAILGSDPDAFVPAIQRNERVLFKIHGDCENRRSLTLTLDSYADSYGRTRRSKARESLRAMLPLLLENRPVLFLGCSLKSDRTLDVVKDVHDRHAGIWHYAVVAAPYDVKAFDKRHDELLALGIQPLWFPPGEFECIRERLRELLEDISVETVYEAPAPARPSTNADAVVRAPASPAPLKEDPPSLGMLTPNREIPTEFVDVAKAVGTGRVVFFLGAGAASGLLGKEFYRRLAASERIPEFGRHRADAAQHIVDLRKRNTLVAGIKKILEDRVSQPSRTHRFLARRGTPLGRTAPPGGPDPLIIMTTNQDRGLEVAFEEVGHPYHLFVYQPHGPYEGFFLHRRPSGDVRVLRKPENMIEIGDQLPVIAKLNGGIGFAPGVPDTFAATNRDFYFLAARIPQALPACLAAALRQRPLLFLAHGLDAPDVEEIIRYRHDFAQELSWAVQWSNDPAYPGPDPNEVAYWRQLGLELLWQDVDVFIQMLELSLAPASQLAALT